MACPNVQGQCAHPLPPPTTEGLAADLRQLGLRYFTPGEVAALHSFPATFSFPTHVTLRQRYALLGNSLSASVVAALLRYLLRRDTADPAHQRLLAVHSAKPSPSPHSHI